MTVEPSTETACIVLLPSMRVGRPYSKRIDGKLVYLTTEGQLVCSHGELSSTISYWTHIEKKAKLYDMPAPQRGGAINLSVCDCQTTEGLNVSLPKSTQIPTKPDSLFELLQANNTEMIKVKGREARRIPAHTEQDHAFLSTVGQITCRHGASRRSLIKKERATASSTRLPACGCKLASFSLHGGIQLGIFSKCRHSPSVV
jgi:hypothetical protein